MSMMKWAENEVRIACERENPNRKEGEFDYGCACYESALKAYKSLMEDGHSGYSIGVTREILYRLLCDRPLTPIEDTDDAWNDVTCVKDEYTSYQCKRMSSLFKDVYTDGRVKYHDVDMVCCIDDESGATYHNGFISNIIHEMFPIKMPYHPKTKPFKVYCRDYLYDPANGDFDTMAIFRVENPVGGVIEINRYFKESCDSWEEISEEEFKARKEGIKS